MMQRLSRFRRAIVVVVAVVALGGQQASAALICLPPVFCALSWLFAVGTVAQTAVTSRTALTASGESEEPVPPLCLTEPVSLSVWAEPVHSQTQVSQTVTVKIYGDFSQPVVSFGFHLDYDSTLLTLTGLTPASSFHALNPTHAHGVAGLAYPDGLSGDRVLLATARFRANAVGTSDIGLVVTPNDPTEGFEVVGSCETQNTLTPASVTIVQREPPPPRPPPPIPEPTSLLCVLAGMGMLRRR
jgi:hypothetical protein